MFKTWSIGMKLMVAFVLLAALAGGMWAIGLGPEEIRLAGSLEPDFDSLAFHQLSLYAPIAANFSAESAVMEIRMMTLKA